MQKERATQIRQNWIETACTKTKIGTNKMQISSRYEPLPWLHGTEDGQQGAIWIHYLIIKFNAAPSKCITILLSYRITFQHFRWKCALSTYLLILLIDCCRRFIFTEYRYRFFFRCSSFSGNSLNKNRTHSCSTSHVCVCAVYSHHEKSPHSRVIETWVNCKHNFCICATSLLSMAFIRLKQVSA